MAKSGIATASGFLLNSTSPLDGRLLFDDLTELLATEEYNLYDGLLAYVKAEDKLYQFKSTNSEDVTLKKWREFSVDPKAPETKSISIKDGGQGYVIGDVLEFNTKFYDVTQVSVLGAVEGIKSSTETAARTDNGTGAVLEEVDDVYGLSGTTWKKIVATGGGNVSVDELLDENITVTGVDVGNLVDGTTIVAGTSFTDLLKQMLRKRIAPEYKLPKATLSGDVTTFEKGVSTPVSLTAIYTQNDGGAATSTIITDGVAPSAEGATASYTITDSTTFSVDITHGEGDIKNDNFGEAYPTGHIEAGTVTGTYKATAVDPIFTGTGSFDPSTNKGTKHLVSKPSKEVNYTYSVTNDTCFIAAPYEISGGIKDQNNFDVFGTFAHTTVAYTREDGTSTTYHVYTNSPATLTNFVFKVTF